jgi:ribosome maturation factor RimP
LKESFFNTSQLHDYVGEKLKIKLKNPMNNMKNINGELLDVVHESFFVNFNDESIELSFNDVDTCILIPDYKKLFEDKNNAK